MVQSDGMGWNGMGCRAVVMQCVCAMWLAAKSCGVVHCGCRAVIWEMVCWKLEHPCHRKFLETSIPMRRELGLHSTTTLRCTVLLRTTKQILPSTTTRCKVLERTTKYYYVLRGTTLFRTKKD